MRLLIVGSDKVHAIENFYVKYLRGSVPDVVLFPATSIFHDYYYKSLFNKLVYRAGISPILTTINKKFKKLVEDFDPACIWIFKGMELFPSTLEWVRNRGIKLANYNPDNPFIFTGRGSGNKNITDSLSLYDLQFTYSMEIKRQLMEASSAKVVLLPFAYDIPDAVLTAVREQTEIIKTCFLGNPDPQRAAFIQQLAEMGASIDVYGNDWNKFISHSSITVFPPVYELELWKTLARYRVQLNIMRVHNVNSHNMRSFEVPAIGGIQLAPDTPEHRVFFESGKEIFLYSNTAECLEKINYLIQLPQSTAASIRSAAQNRCVASGYSYRNRAAQVAGELKSLLG
ncbi:MAG: glycosyltransferase [Chitinophagaceae bacterium]